MSKDSDIIGQIYSTDDGNDLEDRSIVMINRLVARIHLNAVNKGFWDDYNPDDIHHKLSRIMLAVTELAESVEALRDDDNANFAEELADTLIRVLDMCGGFQVDVGPAMFDKMRVNESRKRMHGKKA